MSENRAIPVADLVVDNRNPRLEEGIDSHVAALHSMLRHQNRKILALAADIVENGVNPAERLIVMADTEGPGAAEAAAPGSGASPPSARFIVLEGNRRVTALKLLETPSIAKHVVSSAMLAKFQALSARYVARPIQTMDCVIVSRREDASHWMTLRHQSGREGAGVEAWGALEQERFASWRAGVQTAAIQIRNVVLEHGGLDAATKERVLDVPTSSYMRVVQTPDAARMLGLDYNRRTRELRTHHPEEEVARGLSRLLRDLATGVTNSRSLNTKAEIVSYVKRFKSNELPAKKTKLKAARTLSVAGAAASHPTTGAGGKTGSGGKGPATKPQAHVVPSTCRLRIGNARLRDVFTELRVLLLDRHANAIAVLFRVFVELSADQYLESNALKTEKELDGMVLRDKMISTVNALKAAGALNSKQYDAVRRAAQDQLLLATGVKTFHSYVHNQYVHPRPVDLVSSWNQLQPFFEAIWQ
jgi:hypothetical protein